MTVVCDSLPAYEGWLAATARTTAKYQALQVAAIRALSDWHATAYGCPLMFDDLTPETLRLYRAHRQVFDTHSTLNRKRAAWRVF